MSNLEHYFENLLFHGQDVNGDWNKNTLSEAEQEAVRICADYVLYTIFLNRDDFLKFVNGNTHADRFRAKSDEELAEAITADWCSIVCPGGSFFCDGECKTKVLDWLRQETK